MDLIWTPTHLSRSNALDSLDEPVFCANLKHNEGKYITSNLPTQPNYSQFLDR